jgi:hypothetical protein
MCLAMPCLVWLQKIMSRCVRCTVWFSQHGVSERRCGAPGKQRLCQSARQQYWERLGFRKSSMARGCCVRPLWHIVTWCCVLLPGLEPVRMRARPFLPGLPMCFGPASDMYRMRGRWADVMHHLIFSLGHSDATSETRVDAQDTRY